MGMGFVSGLRLKVSGWNCQLPTAHRILILGSAPSLALPTPRHSADTDFGFKVSLAFAEFRVIRGNSRSDFPVPGLEWADFVPRRSGRNLKFNVVNLRFHRILLKFIENLNLCFRFLGKSRLSLTGSRCRMINFVIRS